MGGSHAGLSGAGPSGAGLSGASQQVSDVSKAPLVKARANRASSCYDPTCSYKNRTNCLDAYIKNG